MATTDAPAVGIDLGTVDCCIGVWEDDHIKIVVNEYGKQLIPSYVAFKDTWRMIGELAKNQVITNPRNTIFDVKRLIGKRYWDNDVQQDLRKFHFVANDVNDMPQFIVNYIEEDKQLSAEEITAMILGDLKQRVEKHLNTIVEDVVITVPACFTNSQRQAMKDAAVVAGFRDARIMNEPSAAALGYYFLKKEATCVEDNVLIFDLGGGTFDVSLVSYEAGNLTVKATAGDNHLGGEDFTSKMLEYFVKEISLKHRMDISNNLTALRQLREACERAKKILSVELLATVEVDLLDDRIHFISTIARPTFEDLNFDLFETCLKLVKFCLESAEIEKTEVSSVVLLGGSSRIPKVQNLLQEFFDGRKLWEENFHPDHLVVHGATLQATLRRANISPHLMVNDVVPYAIGTELISVIPRNTPCPTQRMLIKTTDKENQAEMDLTIYEYGLSRTMIHNFIGDFIVKSIALAPIGYTQVQFIVKVSIEGILKIEAVDMTYGHQQVKEVEVEQVRKLSDAEIAKMIQDAGIYRSWDERYMQNITGMVALEHYAIDLRKNISSINLTPAASHEILEAINRALEWLKNNRLASPEEHGDQMKELDRVYESVTGRNPPSASVPVAVGISMGLPGPSNEASG